MDPSLLISAVSVGLAVLTFVHSRSKESTDAVDSKISTVFSRVDALREELTDMQRQMDRDLMPRADLRDIMRDMTERIGRHEGRIETLLEAITALREKLAARGRQE